MEDPVAGIFNMMQNEGAKRNPPNLCTGKVISPPPNLSIKTGELELFKEDLKVADYLLKDYTRECYISGTLQSKTQSESGGSGDSSFASHFHSVSSQATVEGTVKFTDTLKEGDEVAMLPSYDGNTFFVLFKVVSL